MSNQIDHEYLRSQQYGNANKLNARIQIHTRFATNTYGWQRWVFDKLTPRATAQPATARVLEAGCGTAQLFGTNFTRIPPGWRIMLTDFSRGMLADARRGLGAHAARFHFAAADIQALPCPGEALDAVIANHMLYHVPDRPRALAEVWRVLKPGGYFYAATNGQYHMGEVLEDGLARRYHVTGKKNASFDRRVIAQFSLENGGEQLAAYFTNVRLYLYEDGLEVTEVEPLIAYILTTMTFDEADMPRLRAGIAAEIAQKGAVHVTKSQGMFVAEKQV
jgi:ubiquinone/menaquinone biosynthesis C-methylase UbiE